MSSSVATVGFGALFALAIIWLAANLWLFRRLRPRHPVTYEAIGSPDLFQNNTLRTTWLFFKFLFGGQWQSLDDPSLAVVARAMQVLFVVYFTGFAAFLATVATIGVKRA
jgi:hypothetical protein